MRINPKIGCALQVWVVEHRVYSLIWFRLCTFDWVFTII